MITTEYRIKDIGEVVGGGTPRTDTPEYWNGNIPWLSPVDLSNYSNIFISKGQNNITELGLKKSSTKLLPKDTVLLSSRAPIGYLAIAENEICTNQGFKSIICDKKKVVPLFLYYYLKLNIEQLKSFASGATFPELSGNTLKKIKIQLPPLPTQQKIASILSAYDKLIQNYKKQIEALQTAASELYKEWFVRFRFPGWQNAKFENGIPEGWKVERIHDYCNIRIGGDVPKENSETKDEKFRYPIFSNGINNDGLYGFTDTFKISEPSVTISARGTVGFVCLRRNPYYPIVRLICLLPKKEIGVFYLYHSLKYVDLDGNGTSQQQLTAPMVSKRKIIIADEKLVKIFNSNAEIFYDKINLLKSKIQNLTQQRDLLLPRLMSGKLEVK